MRIGTVVLMACAGCSSSKQVQYFAAVHPEKAQVMFYRLTLTGKSGILDDYNLRAGYFNAVTLDALTGSLEDPPEVEGDPDQLETVRRIRAELYAGLETWAKRPQPDGVATEEEIVRAAHAYWLASLDPLSLASVGMTKSLDPFVFQKLAFWAESKTVDLEQLGSQFEDLIRNSRAVAKSIRARATAREDREAKERREESLSSYFDALRTAVQGETNEAQLTAVIDALERLALQQDLDQGGSERERAMRDGLLGSLEHAATGLDESIQALVGSLRAVLAPGLLTTSEDGVDEPETPTDETPSADTASSGTGPTPGDSAGSTAPGMNSEGGSR